MLIDEIKNNSIDNENFTLKVSAEEVNTRIDAFLASRIQDWSRSQLQKLIDNGDVLVNGKTSKSSYKLRENDEIEVELIRPYYEKFTPEDIPLNIIHEDDSIIVINKAAGMIVHPGAGATNGTLANAVAYHLEKERMREREKGGEEEDSHLPFSASPLLPVSSSRPGIVHRLDKDTSGLIVVAKNQTAHEHLSEQFRERKVYKSYIALVHGVVKEVRGKIEEPIGRDPRNRTRMAVVRGGRPALSIYRVKKSFDRFTLLDVEIKTGRTHQIRVHLAHIKHPVVGDETYNGGRDKAVVDVKSRAAVAKLHRVFLHAEQLGFFHPTTNEWMKFKAEMPDELNSILEVLQ